MKPLHSVFGKPRRTRRRRRTRRMQLEKLGRRDLLTADFWNPYSNLDVNNDGVHSPIDALIPINSLNSEGGGALVGQRQDAEWFVREKHVELSLDPAEETDKFEFSIEADLGFSSATEVGDRLLVYIDSLDGDNAVLDGGFEGSPIFSLTGDSYQVVPGISQWNGQEFGLDLSEVTDLNSVRVRFQLANFDPNHECRARISDARATFSTAEFVGRFQQTTQRLAVVPEHRT